MRFLKGFILAAAAAGAGCATVYTAADFDTYDHRTVAILPFTVSFPPDSDTSAERMQQQREEASYQFQQQLYTRFLQRLDRYTVVFQDVTETNAQLATFDIGYAQLARYSRRELAELLDVDAVISGQLSMEKPMGTGAAIVTSMFFGFGATNQVNATMQVHDGATGALVWSYDHEVSGGLGSSPEGVAESLMRGASKKFPYDR